MQTKNIERTLDESKRVRGILLKENKSTSRNFYTLCKIRMQTKNSGWKQTCKGNSSEKIS